MSATRTWRVSDSHGNHADCSQTISTPPQVELSGHVWQSAHYPNPTPSDTPIDPVLVNVTGGLNLSTQTAADGAYRFGLTPGVTCIVTPTVTNSDSASEGVTTVDISMIRRHILNITPLGSPYKILAADVNGSDSVTTLDISLMRRVVLGITNNFPLAPWRFVPSDYVFANPAMPWDAPDHRSYAALSRDATNQDFIGIKLGDVNNSWKPSMAMSGGRPADRYRSGMAPLSADEIHLQISSHETHPGGLVVVRVTTSGFHDMTSLQGTLAWDPGVVRFEGAGTYGLRGLGRANFGAAAEKTGRLPFSWDDPEALGVTAPAGTTLFTLKFSAIGAAGEVSKLFLVDEQTPGEAGIRFTTAALRAQEGRVEINRSLQIGFVAGR
jgi:hypothetical protein